MDFRKVVFQKKAIILGSCIQENLVQGNFYRRSSLVTRSTYTIRAVTWSTSLTTRSTL